MRTAAASLGALALLAACEREPEPVHDPHAGHGAPSAPQQGVPLWAEVELSPERVQRFGVRTEKAVRAPFARELRTVGIVRTDETRESHVHVKWIGWIEELRVAYVGQEVALGEPLFSVYSPELVTAEQELLIALGRADAAKDARADEQRSAAALVDAARTKLRLWDVPPDAIAKLEQEREVQRTLPVRAPRAGTVLAKNALAGMYVEPDMDLYTVADLSVVWVLADLYEYEAPAVAAGLPATFAPIGSGGEETAIEAKVAFVHPTVDPDTRTVKVRLEVRNDDRRLRPGAFGTVRLSVPLGESVLIPSDALIAAGDRRIVFVARGGGRFAPREVQVGAQAAGRVQVRAGLQAGEEVVTRAQFLLDSESRLRAAAPAGGKPHSGH
jgi:Cu(I)/Ag(I) efflux system membrane fusion protein